jgi:hypothetical protein
MASLWTTGCSFMFMARAPQPVLAPDYPVECSSSRGAPVLDTICAGYFVVNAAVLASATSCDDASFGETCYESSTKTGGMILSAGLAGLCALSATSGFRNANQCSQVKSLNALCITGNEAACVTLTPGWTPRADRFGSPSPTRPSPVPASSGSSWNAAPATP